MKQAPDHGPEKADERFMAEALKEAGKAAAADEVPVGAVVVCEGRIIARAHNLCERLRDVTAHAEMQVVTAAANYLGGKYLNGCTLYVTLEPCVMCAGALRWARIDRLVYGAADDKMGYTLVKQPLLHPKTRVKKAVLAESSAQWLRRYFQDKRK